MAKTIGLKQLAQKKYTLLHGLPPELCASLGNLSDAWDAILYGPSGSGKTNCTVLLIKSLLKNTSLKANYISFEEGHSKTIQDLFIRRHNMLEEVGNRLGITEHIPYEDLIKRMSQRQSPKIWVIDSIQASGFTYDQIKYIKEQFVLSKRKKIVIYISWSDGNKPKGSTAKATEYYADLKLYVEKFIMFPRSRFGGNKPYIIWEDGAKRKWGRSFYKISETERPPKIKKDSTPQISTDATVNS